MHKDDREINILESFGLVLGLFVSFSIFTARVLASVECCACSLRRGQPGNNSFSELQTLCNALVILSDKKLQNIGKYRVFL